MASTTDPTERAAYIAGLRALADAMESTPIPMPLSISQMSYYPRSVEEYRAIVEVVTNIRKVDWAGTANYPVHLTGHICGFRVTIGIRASLAEEIFPRSAAEPVYEYDLSSVVAS